MFYRSIAEFEAKAAPTTPELALIAACRAGEPCILGDGTLPDGHDPTRTIRADLLRLLIVGGTAECGLHPSGVWVIGSFVPDKLDLSFETGKGACRLQNCCFRHAPQLTHTHLPQLGFNGSHLPGLFAQGCMIEGDLFLRDLKTTGTVFVTGAQISGQLACDRATLDGAGGGALNAQGIETGTGVFLNGVTTKGTIDVNGAKIGGQLSCKGAKLDGAGHSALNAQGVETGGSIFLRKLSATGTVDVAGAKIGGQLSCTGATLNGAGEKALNAQAVVTGDGMFLTGLTATGTVHVIGAKIGGQLSCEGAKLDGAGDRALNAQDVVTGASMFLTNITATGTVTVNNAKIGGQLDCTGATLDGVGEKALNAQGVETGDSMFLRGITATGTVDVNGAKIGGQLTCKGATLNGAGGIALNAQQLTVKEGLFFRELKSVEGSVDLSSAHVGDLMDDMAAWSHPNTDLSLAGFTYDKISRTSPQTFASRKDWLRRGSNANNQFNPQPYTQFAKVLRAMGNAPEARKVLFERDSLLADATLQSIRAKPDGTRYLAFENPVIEARIGIHLIFDRLSRWVIGYGHKPWGSLFALFALFFITTALAQLTWNEGSFAPNSDVILTSQAWLTLEKLDCVAFDAKGNRLPPAPKCDANPAFTWSNDPAGGLDWDSFNRYGYAADLVIPILDLGQTDAWAPSKDRGPFGKTLWWGRWVLAALGWLVTALGVAAITGIMQRNSPEA